MTNRTWVFSRLNHASIKALVPGGIYPATHLEAVPSVKPFLMYRMLPENPTMSGDDGHKVKNVAFWVFAHDVQGDYMQIDTVLEAVRLRLDNVIDSADNIIRCKWESTSEDLRDRDMDTITKFSRYRLIYKTTD